MERPGLYSDPKIDSLLASPFVDLLRRFRNATFHFQPGFVSTKWAAFLEEGQESSTWIMELRDAFSDFFLREDTWTGITPSIPEEVRVKIAGKPVDQVLKIIYDWWRKRSGPSSG